MARAIPSTYISGAELSLFYFLFLLDIGIDKSADTALTFPQKISLSQWEQFDYYMCGQLFHFFFFFLKVGNYNPIITLEI